MAKSRGVLSALMMLFGVLLALSGSIFTLQGFGIVGPSNGFMFESQIWVRQGLAILVIGIAVLLLGVFFRPRQKKIPVSDEGPQKSTEQKV
jgi:hypothetical protein